MLDSYNAAAQQPGAFDPSVAAELWRFDNDVNGFDPGKHRLGQFAATQPVIAVLEERDENTLCGATRTVVFRRKL